MEKEFIRETNHSVSLNITAGKVDSFRETEKTTGTVRVYENGFIGVAGCLGEPDWDELTKRAVEALEFKIPYPCALEGALDERITLDDEIIPIPEFIHTIQRFLDRLGELCPRFAFSNKINLVSRKTEYRNSHGRHLVSSGSTLEIGLLAQNRGSGNLFDAFFVWDGNEYDEEKLLSYFKEQYDAFFVPAEIESGRYPVLFMPGYIMPRLFTQFMDDMYASGVSLVSGKFGEKLFSDKLTFGDDMNPASHPAACFFDAEGCVSENYRPLLIENGVLKGILTTKKTAENYGLPNFGNADAAYDGTPGIGFHNFYFDPTAKSLAELLPEKAIFAAIPDGGDMTPAGHYATPVQLAYLMENGRIIGRLPDLNVSGEFFDILGKDYIGTVKDDPMKGVILCAFEMNVKVME